MSLNVPAGRGRIGMAADAIAPAGTTPIPVNGSGTTRNVSLCVAVQRSQSSVDRGQAASWVVSAWTKGGTVPDATIRLVTAPASLSPQFSFGCGSHDGTASCDLGEVAAQAAQRQLQATVAVPATATSVTSVQLRVIASAAHLPTDPVAAATVSVGAAPVVGTGNGTGNGGGAGVPTTTTSPLPIGSLPNLNAPNPSLSPGGNAGGLFPTVTPSPDPSSAGTQGQGQQKASARTVANTSALPLGAPVVGAQVIGLGVLALAFVLAVTRLSIRRRPVPSGAGGRQARSSAAAAPPAASATDVNAKDAGVAKDPKDAQEG